MTNYSEQKDYSIAYFCFYSHCTTFLVSHICVISSGTSSVFLKYVLSNSQSSGSMSRTYYFSFLRYFSKHLTINILTIQIMILIESKYFFLFCDYLEYSGNYENNVISSANMTQFLMTNTMQILDSSLRRDKF